MATKTRLTKTETLAPAASTPHHRRHSNPNEYGTDAACPKGVSPFDFPEIKVKSGQRDPFDDAGAPDVVGLLRYVPAG